MSEQCVGLNIRPYVHMIGAGLVLKLQRRPERLRKISRGCERRDTLRTCPRARHRSLH